MISQERQVLQRFKKILTDMLKDSALEARIFGSKARGDDREGSDVDVLVVVSGDSWQIADQVYDAATDLLLETGICISPKVLSWKQYAQLKEDRTPFLMNVALEGVTV